MIPEVVHEHFLKVPVVQREDFEILLEQHVSGTFVHCNVKNYNATVKREIQRCWKILTELHGGPIYALHDLPDHKHRKFLCLFGFKRHQVLPNLKELWIWRPVYG
jgi:hypothetical protein